MNTLPVSAKSSGRTGRFMGSLKLKFLLPLVIFLCELTGRSATLAESMPLTKSLLDFHSADRSFPQVAPQVAAKMVEELRWAQRDPEASVTFGARIVVLLLDLGDQATIDAEVSALLIGNTSTGGKLHASRNPKIIPALATVLLQQVTEKESNIGENRRVAPPMRAGALVMSLAARAPQFDPSVHAWANHMFRTSTNNAMALDEARQFWLENESFFSSGNYAAVRPPTAHKTNATTVARTSGDSNVIPALARPPAKRNSSGTVTNPSPVQQKTPLAPLLPAAAETQAPLWPWLLLGFGSLGGWLWWRSR